MVWTDGRKSTIIEDISIINLKNKRQGIIIVAIYQFLPTRNERNGSKYEKSKNQKQIAADIFAYYHIVLRNGCSGNYRAEQKHEQILGVLPCELSSEQQSDEYAPRAANYCEGSLFYDD